MDTMTIIISALGGCYVIWSTLASRRRSKHYRQHASTINGLASEIEHCTLAIKERAHGCD